MSYHNKWIKLLNEQPEEIQKLVIVHLSWANRSGPLFVTCSPWLNSAKPRGPHRWLSYWFADGSTSHAEAKVSFKEWRILYLHLYNLVNNLSPVEKALYGIEL